MLLVNEVHKHPVLMNEVHEGPVLMTINFITILAGGSVNFIKLKNFPEIYRISNAKMNSTCEVTADENGGKIIMKSHEPLNSPTTWLFTQHYVHANNKVIIKFHITST